jgi:hypothetical protein
MGSSFYRRGLMLDFEYELICYNLIVIGLSESSITASETIN